MLKLLKDRAKLIRAIEKTALEKQSEELMAVAKSIRSDTQRFLSFSQDTPGMVSYAAKPEYIFDNDRRVKTTLGRYVRRQMQVAPEKISDAMLNACIKTIDAHLSTTETSRVKVVCGNEITEAYKRSIGTPSCMCGTAAKYTELYAKNPTIVKMAILEEKGSEWQETGRALLWYTGRGILLDRPYPNNSPQAAKLRAWAEGQGYWTRKGDGMPDASSVDFALGDSISSDFEVTLDATEYYPYLDSFHWGRQKNARLTLRTNDDDTEMTFDDTGGSYTDDNRAICCCCENTIDDGAVMTNQSDDTYCQDCYYERYCNCDMCNDETDKDELTEACGKWVCASCLDYHFIKCELVIATR